MITLHPVIGNFRGKYDNYEHIVTSFMDRGHAEELATRLNETVAKIKAKYPELGKSKGGKNPLGDWLKKSNEMVRQLDPGHPPMTGDWRTYHVGPPAFAYAHLDEYLEDRGQ